MLTRRALMLASLALPMAAGSARADDAVLVFINQASRDLIGIVNGNGTAEQKQKDMQVVIDRTVDVAAVAQFCLGRFWRTATAEQRQTYVQLFHRVLLKSITGKLGEFKGVTVQIGKSTPRDADTGVASVVSRPNAAPANVEWLVSTASGTPRIVDVLAEGTSMRLTQRSDYAAFLNQHGSSVDALIAALKQQADAG